MVVRRPICRKGSLWGSCPGPGHPLVPSFTNIYSALSAPAGHCLATRNTAANQPDKEPTLMKLRVWKGESRTEETHKSRVLTARDRCWGAVRMGAVEHE